MDIALAEVEMLRRLGVTMETGVEVGADVPWAEVRARFDAVFISSGLGSTPSLGIPGEEHILDGLAYIEQSKIDPRAMRIGRNVAVIGAGNTAVDCVTIANRLGAERVTMVYRRTDREMTAYPHEYDFAKLEGIEFRFLSQPVRVLVADDGPVGLECIRMELGEPDSSGRPSPRPVPHSEFVIPADQIVKAIGQVKLPVAAALGLQTDKGFIRVNSNYETSLSGVYAGGDCIRSKGAASTVMAVQDGKLAALAIHKQISQSRSEVGVTTHG
jgi:glutamate synthase (NADPH/NADH) small chain